MQRRPTAGRSVDRGRRSLPVRRDRHATSRGLFHASVACVVRLWSCLSYVCQFYVWLASVVHHQSPVVAGELVVGLVVGLGDDTAWVVRVIVDPLSTVWPA